MATKITMEYLNSLLAQYHNAICFGGLFALKQWIFCSLKHDTVPRVKNLYCFYVKKKTQNRLHYGFVQVLNGFLSHELIFIAI